LNPLPAQGVTLLKLGRLEQHQPPGQVRLHHNQNPAQMQHKPQKHDAAQPIEQLSGVAGIEHLSNGPVEGVGRRPSEQLHLVGELDLGVADGDVGLD
jgi:hypothetical protein